MASYTIELRNVCEIYGRSEVENWFKDYEISDYLTPKQIEIIDKSGLFSKDKLASNIVDFYFMREIGLETPYLFKHYAKITMKNVMERELQRIYTVALEIDPLVNVDYTETTSRTIDGKVSQNGNSSSTSNNNNESLGIINNTPQSKITKQSLDTGVYASSVSQSEGKSQINDNTNTLQNGVSNTIESVTFNKRGNEGILSTQQKLIEQYRNIIIDIDEEIINELSTLFMGIY